MKSRGVSGAEQSSCTDMVLAVLGLTEFAAEQFDIAIRRTDKHNSLCKLNSNPNKHNQVLHVLMRTSKLFSQEN